MGQSRISSVMITLLIFSAFVALLGLFLANGQEKYGGDISPEDLEVYNKLAQVSQYTKETQDSIQELQQPQGALDAIGSFFTSAYKSVRTTFATFDAVDEIKNQAIADASVGNPEVADILQATLTSIFVIFLFVVIVLAIIFKWPT